MVDRAEEGVAREGREEFARASDYWQALDDEERDRRGGVDYGVHAAFNPKDDLPALQECPVCELEAFIAEQFDAYVGEIGIGICAACSYRRSEAMANDEGSAFPLGVLSSNSRWAQDGLEPLLETWSRKWPQLQRTQPNSLD